MSIALSKGWNLISIPRSLADPTVGSVFADFANMVYYFDAPTNDWAYASVFGVAWAGNLQMIEAGKGYWVNATRDVSMILGLAAEDPAKPSPDYALPAGWSMIGYTSGDLVPSRPLSEYLASLGDKWVSIYRYDPSKGWEIAKPSGLGFTQMEWGRGYWVNLTDPSAFVAQVWGMSPRSLLTVHLAFVCERSDSGIRGYTRNPLILHRTHTRS